MTNSESWFDRELEPGVFVVNKPLGFSSFFLVDFYKRKFKQKAGHAGTLDPLATGDLIILIGKATKRSDFYLTKPKTYEVTILLGAETISQDLEQEVFIENLNLPVVSDITETITKLQGAFTQTIPAFSAVKKEGIPLYKLAKAGKTVETILKEVQIDEILDINVTYKTGTEVAKEIRTKSEVIYENIQKIKAEYLRIDAFPPKKLEVVPEKIINALSRNSELFAADSEEKFALVSFTVNVTKGTYIRSLVLELQKQLEVPAVLFSLNRKKAV
jgi:tRNA pseudouridine(55) synthase